MQKRAAAVEEKRAAQAKKTGKSSWQHHIMGSQIVYTEWALFDTAGGRGTDILSGRDLFQFDPTLFVDDDDAEQVSSSAQWRLMSCVQLVRYSSLTHPVLPMHTQAYEIATPIYEEDEEDTKSERLYPQGSPDDDEVVHDELQVGLSAVPVCVFMATYRSTSACGGYFRISTMILTTGRLLPTELLLQSQMRPCSWMTKPYPMVRAAAVC